MKDWTEFRDKRICVAVSGGADSIALLHQCKAAEKEAGYRLSAVHCEHGIRGEESVRDMSFVQTICKSWNIPLYLFSENCPKRAEREKISLETAARDFRRESFTQLVEEGKIDFIVTAHHQNDEAETVLFRLARGSSLAGMSAMKEKEGYFLRPLLHTSKGEILAYIEKHGLAFCTDSTNLQTDATRNKLRLEILPRLEAAIPGATENIARFAFLAAEDEAYLVKQSKSLLCQDQEGVTVLFSKEKPLFTRACLAAMKACGVLYDYTATHLNSLFFLQDSQRGAQLVLPQHLRAEKGERGIYFSLFREEKVCPQGEEKNFTLEGYDGGRYEVNCSYAQPNNEGGDWKILRVDAEKIPQNAVFRFRREGDEIRRFGGGNKSLKKFFNEKKIPPQERDYLPLIAEKDSGRVYVVCGVEISEEVKLDANTQKALYITIRKKEK